MNRDLTLQIQSYLDGELSGREARRVQDWIQADPQARVLHEELLQTRNMLRGEVELPRSVPATREFFWSQIQRGIAHGEREKQVPAASGWVGWLVEWRKYAAPLLGAAVVALLAVPASRYLSGDRGDPYLAYLAQVENPSEEVGSYSFRTRSGNMFVVWLYDRNPNVLDSAEDYEETLAQ